MNRGLNSFNFRVKENRYLMFAFNYGMYERAKYTAAAEVL